jgi:hypothetical protein
MHRGQRKEKKKQHKGLENRGKIRKDPDFCSLQRVKDRLVKQVHDRHKEMRENPTTNRYAEIRQAMEQVPPPDIGIEERSAASEA